MQAKGKRQKTEGRRQKEEPATGRRQTATGDGNWQTATGRRQPERSLVFVTRGVVNTATMRERLDEALRSLGRQAD